MSITFLPFLLVLFYLSLIMLKSFAKSKKMSFVLLMMIAAITLSGCSEDDQASAADNELIESTSLIEELEATIGEKDEEIGDLTLHIEEIEDQLDTVEEDYREELEEKYENEISSLEEQITEKDDQLSNNKDTISKLEDEIATLSDELETAKAETESASASTSEASEEESSNSCPAGSININTASESELQGIYEIGPDRASQIMQLRPFSSYNDMKRISGIGDARAQAIEAQGMVCFD
ncbi:competence protein ComEA [Alkalihalobacillus xiaoxiensis]|uniref:Competence protein ComEA n=1 Tax=Shouchella xiaoxiensis TaxID=766895 RepID=A0ABS2SXX7_9BACI|nr:helix-hairpin-helix domain-containing protein [Shouchella xiaoxiensis]MBM7839097.1 competence protein ComEA [Shouchella xiaoxiensis]